MRVLAAPLDWGLGHATRMLPILRQLQQQGAELIIGYTPLTQQLLQLQLPQATFVEVPSYHITYSRRTTGMAGMLGLIPRIWRAKRKEYKVVAQLAKRYQPQLILSDNRYGFRHPHIRSIIISHQLQLSFPPAWQLLGRLAQSVNHAWLRQFDSVWVPDDSSQQLSGSLSTNSTLPLRFIGQLSRFQPKPYHRPMAAPYILCVVSGPEPQRSLLEQLLRQKQPQPQQHIVLIGGQPQATQAATHSPQLHYFPHLPDEQFAAYLQHADCIVSRSGYSSLMDYACLACKKVFLIPTPGQSEQIYLAQRLRSQKICDYSKQADFNWQKVIDTDWKQWKGFETPPQRHLMEVVRGEFWSGKFWSGKFES